ncbi:MAG: transcriptional regulator [Lachnospiraceae bacterium]|nr:transcriptional regulator [Lachnospiraceae bacterium]MDE6601730.1 transcriptional regulator [Lachnospiraceae bacterium]
MRGVDQQRKRYAIADTINGQEIKCLRKSLELTQAEFARFVNVSVKTIERWEIQKTPIRGEIVTLCRLIREDPGCIERFRVPECHAALRLWYGREEDICTIMDVSPPQRRVKICNYTKDLMCRAFGKIEEPTYEQYEAFLESRCFPGSRDKMKLMLEELDLPFYDPLMIIEKTEGRMADDDFWLRVERNEIW